MGKGGSGGRGNKKKPSADSAEGLGEPKSKGETIPRVAKTVGMGKDRYKHAQAVVEAAEKAPETFGPINFNCER